ncbi:hypothetical protein GCM10023322_07000 [Rugosimonospora acidiphila]|uniref:ABC3 transporter permease C-terminal domain-containing protein n=1 Tax=Rugosimonospora acidiphila TaxID=556531 RepID=A0ABP9RKJ9_9ACTN
MGIVLAQLRHRFGRAVALLAALLVAVTSFAVLTATVSTQRLEVTGTVNNNARGAYDLLVRPAGSKSDLEVRDNLVSSTALTSLTGGITTAQWQRILKISGVGVAAPIALVGYALPTVNVPVDLSGVVTPGQKSQVYRVESTQISERGLTSIPAHDQFSAPGSYVFISNAPMGAADSPNGPVPVLNKANGEGKQICPRPTLTVNPQTNEVSTFVEISCGSINATNTYNAPGGANSHASGSAEPTGVTSVSWTFPYLIEAIDPVQEAKLVGLNTAVTKGNYFSGDQGPTQATGTLAALLGDQGADGDEKTTLTRIPVLLANRTPVDEQLKVAVSRLPAAAADQVAAGLDPTQLVSTLPQMSGTPVTTLTVDAPTAYSALLAALEGKSATNSGQNTLDQYLSALPITYNDQGSGLAASALPKGANPLLPSHALSFRLGTGDLGNTGDLVDTATRSMKLHVAVLNQQVGNQVQTAPGFDVVGEFDPAKLTASSSGLGGVPMETYFPAAASGADPTSRAALGGKTLLPNGNVRGLLSVPPSMITTLSALSVIDNPKQYDNTTAAAGVSTAAPISVIRVRLSGALGLDAASRERVRLIAQEIHDQTGLDVDVTMGSSPAPVTIQDPAGRYGRPALALSELWSRKGVAALIVSAVDRKSLILFILVLVVCALFVTGATGAAVRARRTELAVLACLGWPPRRLFGLILTEVGALGLVAGIAGALLSLPIGHLVGVPVDVGRAALAVPAALLLAVIAALWPAIQSSRAHPGAAVSPAVSGPKRAVRLAGIFRLSLANLRRVPGRAVLGATALGVGVAALVSLAGISSAFHGAVTGTLLGDAVSVQVRGTDYVAAAIAAALGAFTVVDMLYINIRERFGEYALLHAIGWDDGAVVRLVLSEAAVMAAIGAVGGGVLAWVALTVFGGPLPGSVVLPSAGIVVVAVLLTVIGAAAPVSVMRRSSAAAILAED